MEEEGSPLVGPSPGAQAPRCRGDRDPWPVRPHARLVCGVACAAAALVVAVAWRRGGGGRAFAASLARVGRHGGRRGRAAARGLDDDGTNPFNLTGASSANATLARPGNFSMGNFSMSMDDDLTALERCAEYDDDAVYTRSACASCDHAACFLYCSDDCVSRCGNACGGNVSSGAMCALDTINDLEFICEAEGYCASAAAASTAGAAATVAASSCTGCDSHALCTECVEGDEGALCAHLMDEGLLTSAFEAMVLISDMNATCAAYACKGNVSYADLPR